ncbi:mycothiol system anti-sigma-R factor [Actinoalloteichus hoggarensis]|uniref:Anti-sigma factor RshA n=1 Tax=Actinoalloteichus hoggarensis TaxID=1470176 RepID=A0A221WA42_9PSEU|nr:mycothiol system anti-sigma-R factor [Actinoalloteichus hoggarensis]ASO22476.1 Anti-sigma factor RshA [Actinoalloteichus hoggarensis]MBB5923100.1 mycothiol system anti-sigma-R factor [Actinoalloteichus hoggarensis]
MSDERPHETPCTEVLGELWLLLDHECPQGRGDALRRHLDECGPCLEHFGIEEHLKELLARKCGNEQAPDALKERLRTSIRQTVLEQAQVTVEHGPRGRTVEVELRTRTTDTAPPQRVQVHED